MTFWQSESIYVKRLLGLSIWLFLYISLGIGLHLAIDSAWGTSHPRFSKSISIIYLIIYGLQSVALVGALVYYIIDHQRRKRYGYLLDQVERDEGSDQEAFDGLL